MGSTHANDPGPSRARYDGNSAALFKNQFLRALNRPTQPGASMAGFNESFDRETRVCWPFVRKKAGDVFPVRYVKLSQSGMLCYSCNS